MANDLPDRLQTVVSIARQAGDIAMTYVNCDVSIETKDDQSPVTEADKAVNTFLVAQLQHHFPGEAIIDEENIAGTGARVVRDKEASTWYVDPIDGTREFIKGTGVWAVMIGLTRAQSPVLGVIYQPTKRQLFYAYKGGGAFKVVDASRKERLHASTRNEGLTYVRSHRRVPEGAALHLESFARSRPRSRVLALGSFGLQLAALAEGKADLLVSAGCGGALWDTCPGQILASEAGLTVAKVDISSKSIVPLRYDPTRSLLLDYPVLCLPTTMFPDFM
eukprot:gene8088-12434_t